MNRIKCVLEEKRISQNERFANRIINQVNNVLLS